MASETTDITETKGFKAKPSGFPFGLRASSKFPSSLGPSPQDYFVPPNLTRFGKSNTPAFSLASRRVRSPERKDITPSPAEYDIRQVNHKLFSGPSFSIKSRNRSPRDTASPGPCAYSLPSYVGNKSIDKKSSSKTVLITGRDAPKQTLDTPAPNQYEVPNPNIYKERQPMVSLKGKARGSIFDEFEKSPAPNSYYVCKPIGSDTPHFSFGVRHSSKRANLHIPEKYSI